MVSRANLNGRPKMGGVLNRVMNPAKPRAPRPEAGGGVFPKMQSVMQGGGMSGMVGRALAAGREQQASQAQPGLSGMVGRAQARAAKAKSAMQPPVAGEQKRGPRRQPTAREQSRNTREAISGMRGQAESMRSGLENMGATQEEVAAPARGVVERAAARTGRGGVGGRLAAEEQAAEGRAALEATGEIGGTVTEAPVVGPSLNEARRMRSRSGRIRR
jgi:hypothetical protein